jgi:hypothetical protein
MKKILGIIGSVLLLSLIASCSSLGGTVAAMMEAGPEEESKAVTEEAAPQNFLSEDIVLTAFGKTMLTKGIYQGDFFPEAEMAVVDGAGSTIDGSVYIWANDMTFTNLIINGSVNIEFNNCTLGEGVVIMGDLMIQGTDADYSAAEVKGNIIER